MRKQFILEHGFSIQLYGTVLQSRKRQNPENEKNPEYDQIPKTTLQQENKYTGRFCRK